LGWGCCCPTQATTAAATRGGLTTTSRLTPDTCDAMPSEVTRCPIPSQHLAFLAEAVMTLAHDTLIPDTRPFPSLSCRPHVRADDNDPRPPNRAPPAMAAHHSPATVGSRGLRRPRQPHCAGLRRSAAAVAITNMGGSTTALIQPEYGEAILQSALPLRPSHRSTARTGTGRHRSLKGRSTRMKSVVPLTLSITETVRSITRHGER
jgi:hypothetical protein